MTDSHGQRKPINKTNYRTFVSSLAKVLMPKGTRHLVLVTAAALRRDTCHAAEKPRIAMLRSQDDVHLSMD